MDNTEPVPVRKKKVKGNILMKDADRKRWLLDNRELWETLELKNKTQIKWFRDKLVDAGLYSPTHRLNIDVKKVVAKAKLIECQIPGCIDTKGNPKWATHNAKRLRVCPAHAGRIRGGTLGVKWLQGKPVIVGDVVTPHTLYKMKGATCCIPNCTSRPVKNWMCRKHNVRFKRGNVDMNGGRVERIENTPHKKSVYLPTSACKVCGKTRSEEPLTKGFCQRHYQNYVWKSRNIEGKRMFLKCKVHDCESEIHKTRRWSRTIDVDYCHVHFREFKRGFIGLTGEQCSFNATKLFGPKRCTDVVHTGDSCLIHSGYAFYPETVNKMLRLAGIKVYRRNATTWDVMRGDQKLQTFTNFVEAKDHSFKCAQGNGHLPSRRKIPCFCVIPEPIKIKFQEPEEVPEETHEIDYLQSARNFVNLITD